MIANAITMLSLQGAVIIPPPADLVWDLTNTNWELTDVNWEG